MAYYRVSNAIKVLFARLMQELLQEHPEFRDIPVKNHFSKEEREKTQVIITDFSASHQRLDLNNFIDYWRDKVILANIKGKQGTALEWVITNKTWKGPFPEPGIYIVSIGCKNDDDSWEYFVDPLAAVEKEIVTPVNEGTNVVYQLEKFPVNQGSELLIGDEIAIFKRDIDYEIDYSTGKITFLVPVKDFRLILADYRIVGTRINNLCAKQGRVDLEAIPGLVLAFGDRIVEESTQVIVVKSREELLGEIHGGRWDLNLGMLTLAQDTPSAEKLVDYLATLFYDRFAQELVEQGIYITGSHSIGGGNAQLEYEIPDEYNFQHTISFPVQVYWESYKPILQTIRFMQLTQNFDRSPSVLDDEVLKLEEKAARFGSLEGMQDNYGEIRDLGLLLATTTAFVPSVHFIRSLNKWQIGPTSPELKVTQAEEKAEEIRRGAGVFDINPFRV